MKLKVGKNNESSSKSEIILCTDGLFRFGRYYTNGNVRSSSNLGIRYAGHGYHEYIIQPCYWLYSEQDYLANE